MEEVTSFIVGLIQPTIIYEQVGIIAKSVAMYISPILLVLAIAIRTTQVQLDSADSSGKWTTAFRDIFLWGTVLGLYFVAGSMISQFFNSVYGFFDSFGSIKTIAKQLGSIVEVMNANEGDSAALSVITGSIYYWVGMIIFYLSLVAVTTILAFLHLAQALGFGLMFIYGLIAIPLTITNNIKLLQGWAKFAGFILLWPIIESIGLGIVGAMFADTGLNMASGLSGTAAWAKGSVALMFTSLNIIVIMVAVASAFVTNALINNSSPGASLVAPFIAGAMATTAAIHEVNKGGIGAGKWASDKAVPAARNLASAVSTGLSGGADSRMTPVADNANNQNTDTTIAENTADHSSTDLDERSKQQRRGAIINQNSHRES